MAQEEKPLASLSTSELDDLILHGVDMQEKVLRHGPEYTHYMNVVAAAKEEKAKRESTLVSQEEIDKRDLAANIPDDKVSANPLTVGAESKVLRSKDADIKAVNAQPKQKEKIKGIVPQQAETTPENKGQ